MHHLPQEGEKYSWVWPTLNSCNYIELQNIALVFHEECKSEWDWKLIWLWVAFSPCASGVRAYAPPPLCTPLKFRAGSTTGKSSSLDACMAIINITFFYTQLFFYNYVSLTFTNKFLFMRLFFLTMICWWYDYLDQTRLLESLTSYYRYCQRLAEVNNVNLHTLAQLSVM